MRVKPEQVLIYNHITPESRIEKTGMGNDVEAEQNQGSSEDGRGENDQDAGAQHCPAIHGQLHHFQARPTKFEDGGNEIDATKYRAAAQKQNAENPDHLAQGWRGDAERRIGGPTRLGCTTFNEVAAD